MSKTIIHIDDTLCKGTEGCKLCISFCPREVLGVSETLTARAVHPAAAINEENCTVCRLCMLYCPDLAIIVKKRFSEAEVASEAKQSLLNEANREEGEENA